MQQPVILDISQANGELLGAVRTGGSVSMGQDIHALADGTFVTVTAHHPPGEEGWAVTMRDAQGSPLWTASPLMGCVPADGYPGLSTDVDPSGHLIAESLIGTDVCVMSMSLSDAPDWACGAMMSTLVDHALTVNSSPLSIVAGTPNEPIPTWFDAGPIELENVPVCGYASVGEPVPPPPRRWGNAVAPD